MPEHLRSLIVILILATTVFAFANRTATEISGVENFRRRRNLWIALTLVAFLCQNFWIYIVIAILLLRYTSKRESNPVSVYFFLLFLLPIAYVQVPGFGLVNYLFDLSHARLLSLIILLPVLFKLRLETELTSVTRVWYDRSLVVFLFLTFVLGLREPVLSESLRFGVVLLLMAYIPYYVISHGLKNMQDFRDALLSFVLAIMIVAAIAIFEAKKQWLLYGALTEILHLNAGMTEYLARDGWLRAIGTAGQPIALGYLMVVGLGVFLFIQRSVKQKVVRWGGMALLLAGLIAPLSRGPWVGAGVLFFIFFITGRNAFRRLMGMAIVVIVSLSLLTVLPGGERIINLLPFIGNTEKANADYREQLITNALIVIQNNPWIGSVDYLKTPEMEAMRQGQGIIDIVNTYLAVTLNTGYLGLGLFITFFALTLSGIYRAMRSISDKNSEIYLLGQALLSTLVAILVIIFSVSSITIIPLVYWSVAGLGVAYTQMVGKLSDNKSLKGDIL